MENERVIWQGKPEWRGYIIALIIFGIIAFPGVIILFMTSEKLPIAAAMPNLLGGGVPFVILLLKRMQYNFTVTN